MNSKIGVATSLPSRIPAGIIDPATYVPLPRRLLDDLRDSPIAIGIYALLGRLTQLTNAPIPLSAADLHAYDPALSYGAARRALERLVDAGYATVTRRNGRKGHYVPCWGMVQGSPRPWDYRLSHVGRPRHVGIYRLDDRLLDLCLGTIRPHTTHAAIVRRYVVTPLLSIRDVGAYALALAHLPSTSPTLHALGLIDAVGHPLPLPDSTTVLAIASQRAGLTGAGGLTPEGWQRVGVTPPLTPSASVSPLFFVPPEVIGGMIALPAAPLIGNLIGIPMMETSPETASVCVVLQESSPMPASHGSDRTDESYPPIFNSVGGEDQFSDELPSETGAEQPAADYLTTQAMDILPATTVAQIAVRPRTIVSSPAPQPHGSAQRNTLAPTPEASDAPTASEQSLRALGVRRDVARSFAAYPLVQVERVIAQARARRDLRDVAGWVVSALRSVAPMVEPDPERPKVSVSRIWEHPTLTPRERAIWLQRFRSADPVDQPAIVARLYAEHPCGVKI